jgi:putative peptide zinc metalloprotease protein
MDSSLFSSSWYRVAELKPRLRAHARIHRHVYRDRPWYVLEDVVNQRVHRFTPATHSVIGLMDGRRTLHEVWQIATENMGDDAPTQDEMIRLLAQLHTADVLQCDVPPDTVEVLQRFEKTEGTKLRKRLLMPMAQNFSLLDPDRMLRWLVPKLGPLLGPLGFALWLAVVLPAAFLAGVHWTELTEGILDKILMPQNLFVMWLIFPLVKIFHEFGHGVIARRFGVEVHDMGVMLLVITPVPYVDASSASALPEKHRRALVGAGGMIFELLLAALAFYVWLNAEPGVVRSLAYNVMVLAGVTTLTFNANPLLRFDGYYILSDLIEIPNLRQRSNGQVRYLAERWLLGNQDAEPPDTSGSEPVWLTVFAIAAFCYRVFVVVAIMFFVFNASFLLGIVIGGASALNWVAKPIYQGFNFLFRDPRLRNKRSRALTAALGGIAALVLILFVLPLPYRTLAEGVVWTPEDALVRAKTSGFVQRFVAEPGTRVRAGDLLIECSDPDLEATAAVLEARLAGATVEYRQARVTDLPKARLLAEDVRHLEEQLARIRQRLDGLLVRAGRDGMFVVLKSDDLLGRTLEMGDQAGCPCTWADEMMGRFVEQGQLMAYVVDVEHITIRAVIPQEDVELVRERLEGVAVRRAERLREVQEARFVRLVPAASSQLPSVALGREGGGQLAVDPRDQRGVMLVQPVFEAELEIPRPPDFSTLGGRVYVRFDHGLESLAVRGWRSLRQLFMKRLNV